MRRFLKWCGIAALIVAIAIAALFAVSWGVTQRALSRTYRVDDPPLAVSPAAASLDRGRHLFETRGCGECHGAHGEGRVLVDDPVLGRIVPPNLTRVLRDPAYDDAALAAVIRHGVRPDGTPLLIMPTQEFVNLDDADVAALIAYARSLPASANEPGTTTIRPIGRVLYTLGKLGLPLIPAEHIDHTPRVRLAPPAAITADYGRYVAQSCIGCHGAGLAGGIVVIPGKPVSANLTPDATGLGKWSEDDFLHLMHTGKRPDGSSVDPLMPWPAYSQMSDVELRAIWAYLDTLPALPLGRNQTPDSR